MRPIDTIEIPDEREPEDNMPDALADRLTWDYDFIADHDESGNSLDKPEST